MKEQFQEFKFRKDTRDMIDVANVIIREYSAQGFTLTLRQLYYQFVARGLVPNKQTEYKRLGSVINDGRLAGLIDWAAIEDRTRNLVKISAWNSPQEIITAIGQQYKEDLWANQPSRVEVWIEKEALVGVIERVCKELRVPFFACRGYVSQSEAYSVGERFQEYASHGQRPVILHLGDHDPSGIDMTRDILDRVTMFSRDVIEVRRLALNMDQVREYNPPPNPAKATDSRFEDYLRVHGDESWELDALEPALIASLIRNEVEDLRDPEAWTEAQKAERVNRDTIATVGMSWEEIKEFLI